jgi:hypothetical protein
MPGSSRDYEDEGDESEVCDAIFTSSRRRPPANGLEMFDQATSDVNGYEGKDGDDADADKEDEASEANDRSMQNLED